MTIRPIAALAALLMAGSAKAGATFTVEASAIGAMVLLGALGSCLVLFAMQERNRERRQGQEPVRLRQTMRRYNQP